MKNCRILTLSLPSRTCGRLAAIRRFADRISAATPALLGLLMTTAPAMAEVSPTFKLFVEAPGPYRVSFDDLTAAGLKKEQSSAAIGLFNAGHPTPVWVEDGGDGVFGSGDWLELLGEPPAGWVSRLAEHTRYNVYVVRFDVTDPLRMEAYLPGAVDAAETGSRGLRREQRHEEEMLLLDVAPAPDGRPEERWYWKRLTQLDGEPFTHPLDLSDLAKTGGTIDLRIELRGDSPPIAGMPDHRLEVMIGDSELTAAEWDGTEPYLLQIPGVAADRFLTGENTLKLRVSRRPAGQTGELVADAVLLNSIEIAYPRRPVIDSPWTDFRLSDPATGPLRLRSTDAGFVLYGETGSRMTSDAVGPTASGEGDELVFFPMEGDSSFVAVGPKNLLSPDAIVSESPSRLANTDQRADYIMIAHRRLLAPLQPLATLHRSRGLDVEVIDIQDIYDEFAGGLAQPWAIRDFLEHAYHQWQKPAPRFVLLVGDASRHARNVRVGDANFADKVTPAAGATADPNNRHLIPTWGRFTASGQAATDNYFVAVAGNDRQPDMAIGRLPVVEPAEVTAIVNKTIRYVLSPEVGPWRRDIALLTSASGGRRRSSHSQAKIAAIAAGFNARELRPDAAEADAPAGSLNESLNQGRLIVYDFGSQIDPESIALNPSQRLPVVLSLATRAVPFDSSEVSSLSESLLLASGRGAVALIATSGNGDSSGTWAHTLFKELTRREATIGEAMMRAKHTIISPAFVESINLLGDPAVPLALPEAGIQLTVSNTGDGPLTVGVTLDASAFSGQLQVELVDAELELVRRVTSQRHGFEFTVEVDASAEELAATRYVRAYAWDASRGIDAIGAVELIDGQIRRPPPLRSPDAAAGPGTDSVRTSDGNAETLLADAVAWWSFDSSDSVQDRLTAHPGARIGRVGRADRLKERGFAFPGHGFIDFGADSRFDLGTGDFTFHAWIKTRQARRKVWVILDKRTHAGYHLFNYQGRLGLQIADGSFTNFEGPFVADGSWHHIAVTVDRDQSDGVRWFIDGLETGARQDPTSHQGSLANPAPLTVGGRHHGGGHFVGALDEVGIFRRALSAGELHQIYQKGWPVRDPS